MEAYLSLLFSKQRIWKIVKSIALNLCPFWRNQFDKFLHNNDEDLYYCTWQNKINIISLIPENKKSKNLNYFSSQKWHHSSKLPSFTRVIMANSHLWLHKCRLPLYWGFFKSQAWTYCVGVSMCKTTKFIPVFRPSASVVWHTIWPNMTI